MKDEIRMTPGKHTVKFCALINGYYQPDPIEFTFDYEENKKYGIVYRDLENDYLIPTVAEIR